MLLLINILTFNCFQQVSNVYVCNGFEIIFFFIFKYCVSLTADIKGLGFTLLEFAFFIFKCVCALLIYFCKIKCMILLPGSVASYNA